MSAFILWRKGIVHPKQNNQCKITWELTKHRKSHLNIWNQAINTKSYWCYTHILLAPVSLERELVMGAHWGVGWVTRGSLRSMQPWIPTPPPPPLLTPTLQALRIHTATSIRQSPFSIYKTVCGVLWGDFYCVLYACDSLTVVNFFGWFLESIVPHCWRVCRPTSNMLSQFVWRLSLEVQCCKLFLLSR